MDRLTPKWSGSGPRQDKAQDLKWFSALLWARGLSVRSPQNKKLKLNNKKKKEEILKKMLYLEFQTIFLPLFLSGGVLLSHLIGPESSVI